jgi:hypothetical protein
VHASVSGQVLRVTDGKTQNNKQFVEVEMLQAGSGRNGSEVVRVRMWNGAPKPEVGKIVKLEAVVMAFSATRGGALLSCVVF